MRAYLITILQVRQQYVTEVPLAEHNNVVKAFPSDRTDQPFGISILPRGAWRRWPVANARRSKSSDEDIAIGLIAIARILRRTGDFGQQTGGEVRQRMRYASNA